MSGTPKMTWAQLEEQRLRKLAETRRLAAAAEERKRREAEAREAKRQFEAARIALAEQAKEVGRTLDARAASLPAPELAALRTRLATLLPTIAVASNRAELTTVGDAIVSITAAAEKVAAAEASRRAELARKRSAAEAAVGDIEGLIAGLKADEVVMRWQHHRLVEVTAVLDSARKAVADGRFDAAMASPAQAQACSDTLVSVANEAQLKADQRDYIAQSIARTLEGMGFAVTVPAPEHAGHPATALVFRASNAARHGVDVSVPVEGEVHYTVDGFAHTSEPLRGGGAAPACDEAEKVLMEMQAKMAEQFGVKAGEIRWDGKADPDRRLKSEKDLTFANGKEQGLP